MQTSRPGPRGCAIVAAVLLAAIAVARPAEACSCIRPGPPCEQYWQGAAVFAGRVTSIEPVAQPVPPSSLVRVLVHFEVTEAFRGVSGAEVVVGTGQGGGDCGYAFSVGERYLVYAYDTPGAGLATGICTRTRRLSDAAEDLDYARALRAGGTAGALVFGTIANGDTVAVPGRGYDPLGGVAIVVRGENGTFRAVSDTTGKFQISGVPTGSYDASIETRDDQYADFGPRIVHVRDPRGCATLEAVVRHDTRALGRVVDERGEPVPFLGVELWPADYVTNSIHRIRPERTARTDVDGQFVFSRIPPGRYIVGASPHREIGGRTASAGQTAFLPGVADPAAATVIETGLDAPVRLPDFTWPSTIRLVTVRGRVVDEQGAPAVGAKIFPRGDSKQSSLVGEPAIADADGRFALALVVDERYSLAVDLQTPGRADSLWSGGELPAFTAGEQVMSATIIVKPVPLIRGPGR